MDSTETSPSFIQTAKALESKDSITSCLDLSRSLATSNTGQFADSNQRMTNANASATAQLCEACQKLFDHWYDVQDCAWDGTWYCPGLKLVAHPFDEGSQNGCRMCSLLQSHAASRTVEFTTSVVEFRLFGRTNWSVRAGFASPLYDFSFFMGRRLLSTVANLMQGA